MAAILDRLFRPKRQSVRRFDAAGGGRRWDMRPSFGRTGPETLAASAPIRSRARYFVANDGWAANGVNALVTGLVGAGIVPASAHPDETIRAMIAERHTAWAARADAEGRTNLYGLQASMARDLVVDGEAFAVLETGADGLKIRRLPAEMVDEADTRELDNGGYVVAGIEFDAAGRRVAYHILPNRPTSVFASTGPSVRVPAERVLHVMVPLGPGQVRGVSWLAPVLLKLSELNALEDALLVGAKVAALHAGFLVDQNGTGNLPVEGDQRGSVLESGLEPGTLRFLPSGFDIKFSTPQHAQQTAEFVSHQIRAVAAGLGVPAHLVSGDLRDANYGSLRAGMIAFRQRLEAIQFNSLIPQFCAPVFERAVMALILSGDTDAPDFERDPGAYLAAEHYPPAMPWLDPAKDVNATVTAIEAGLMSRRQAVAERGYSVEALDREIAADRKREAALALNLQESRNV
ncbi:MAG: phage portal protein [Glycocaulis sp.]|mgnify:CR=1 FL=1